MLSRPNPPSPSPLCVPLDGPIATAVDLEAELDRLLIPRDPQEYNAEFTTTDVLGSCSSASSL
jgi:hypothetical protein